jgi:signal peptidase I
MRKTLSSAPALVVAVTSVLFGLFLATATAIGAATGANGGIYRVPSGAMEPTLSIGDIVVAVAVGDSRLAVGDIVVFHPPAGAPDEICGNTHENAGQACDLPTKQESTESYIKRVVAGPGDTMYMKDGRVYLNGKLEPASYADFQGCDSSADCNYTTPIKIPSGDYFMLGDNRDESDDSRFWGPVPGTWLQGRVIAVCSATDNCRSV